MQLTHYTVTINIPTQKRKLKTRYLSKINYSEAFSKQSLRSMLCRFLLGTDNSKLNNLTSWKEG